MKTDSFIKMYAQGWVGFFILILASLLPHILTLGLSTVIAYRRNPMKITRIKEEQ